jgi:hypothetical protein
LRLRLRIAQGEYLLIQEILDLFLGFLEKERDALKFLRCIRRSYRKFKILSPSPIAHTYRKAAIFVAISRKGPWHLARTLATQTGMTNQWLKEQWRLSVKELWVKIHYPATAW